MLPAPQGQALQMAWLAQVEATILPALANAQPSPAIDRLPSPDVMAPTHTRS